MTHPLFLRPPEEVAPVLLGSTLLVDDVGGIIVETEAYARTDPASHSFRGPTPRNAPMFGPPGRAYVYRIYGLHWCLNLVCGPEPGAAVLIRALEPVRGLDLMRERRGPRADRLLCAGPGRLCQALGVTNAHNGQDWNKAPFEWRPNARPNGAVQGPRIGVTRGAETPWRFGLAGSAFHSARFEPAG